MLAAAYAARVLPPEPAGFCGAWLFGLGWGLAPARTFQWAACFSEENSALALTQAGGAVTPQVEGPLASLHGGGRGRPKDTSDRRHCSWSMNLLAAAPALKVKRWRQAGR